ncbi:hypothetical protein LQW54_009291 [Pestalotiopsis sp. IQ-011]
MTYSFRLLRYGTTWYHSHFTLQYADGIFGSLVINGPASANCDEDLGTLFLQDWSHIPAFTRWGGNPGGNPTLENIALDGTNTYTDQTTGVTTGSKMEVVVEQGKTYRLRLINVAIDGGFNFHIDGHNITVIATDLVPVNPYETDQVAVHIGQRYDIIFTANAEAGDYWIRSGWNTNCHAIGKSKDIAVNCTGILCCDSSSTADPTTQDALTVVPPCTSTSGYIAMVFQLDNPGAWIMHCHIAWHASSGLSIQFVELPDNILTSGAIGDWDTDIQNGGSTCANWNSFTPDMPFEQDDPGI